MSSVEERVKNIIVTQLGVKADEVKNEAKFIDDLGADSLDTVESVSYTHLTLPTTEAV